MVKRVLIYIVGIFILALGLVLNTKAGLGVSPILSVPYSLSYIITSLSFGTWTTIIYVVFIVIELLLLRKADVKVLLQLPFSYAFGLIIDLYNKFITFHSDALWINIPVLLVAICLTALGAFLMVQMDLITNPGDGIVNAFAQTLNWPFGKTKLTNDFVMILITGTMTMLCLGHFFGIGIGTVIAAFCTGMVINVYDKHFGRVLANIVLKSRHVAEFDEGE